MKPAELAAVSFGVTLALVVGVRLATAGLIVLATAVLGALLLGPLLLMREIDEEPEPRLPEVRVESVAHSAVIPLRELPKLMLAPGERKLRRGGWPHLVDREVGPDQAEIQPWMVEYIQGERNLC